MLEVGKAILKNSLTYGVMDVNLVTASRKELATLRAVFAYAPYAINGRGILVDLQVGEKGGGGAGGAKSPTRPGARGH